jgi:hypothetical protein
MQNEESNDCPICTETMGKYVFKTPCNHLFDLKCLLLWVNAPESNQSCPMCRSKIDVKEVVTLFEQMNKDADPLEQVSIESLCKLPGVRKHGRHIIFDLDHTEWIEAFKQLIILLKLKVKSHATNLQFDRIMLSLGDSKGTYEILFEIPTVKYFKNRYDEKSLILSSVDDVVTDCLAKIDKVMKVATAQEDDRYEYKGFVKKFRKYETENDDGPSFVKLKLGDDKENNLLVSLRDKGRAKFIVAPSFVSSASHKMVCASLKVLQMQLVPEERVDFFARYAEED